MQVDFSDIQVVSQTGATTGNPTGEPQRLVVERLCDPTAGPLTAFRAQTAAILTHTAAADVVIHAPPPASPEHRYSTGHHHAVPEVFVQLAGSTSFITPDGRCHLPRGAVLLIPPGVVHHEHPGRGSINLIMKIIDQRLAYHIRRARGPQQRSDLIDLGAFCSPSALLDDAARVLDQPATAAHLTSTALHLLATHLAASPTDASPPDLVEHCRVLLLAHLEDSDLTTGAIAEACGCHPDHLTRVVRKARGHGVNRWLNDLRLDRAANLLSTHPELAIATVATRCGFADARYFARVFGTHHGCRPSAYRDRVIASAGLSQERSRRFAHSLSQARPSHRLPSHDDA